MPGMKSVLAVLGTVCLAVAVSHLVLGLGADNALGARLPENVLSIPTLDSQSRFLGTAFSLHGLVLLLGATSIARYAPMLRCVFAVTFAGGLARLLSIFIYGWPPPPVVGLLIVELLLPPLLWAGLSYHQRGTSQATGGPDIPTQHGMT